MVSSSNIEAPAAILLPGHDACMWCNLHRFAVPLPKELPFPRILPLKLLTRNLATDQTRQTKQGFVRIKERVGRAHLTCGA